MRLLIAPQNVFRTWGSVGAAGAAAVAQSAGQGPSASACCPSQSCWQRHSVPLSTEFCAGELCSLQEQPSHQSCRDLNTVLMICCCCLSGFYHTQTMQSSYFYLQSVCVCVFGITLVIYLLINGLIYHCPGLLSQKKVQWHWISQWKKSQGIHPFPPRRQALAFWQQPCPGENFPVTPCQKQSKNLLNHWYVTF